VKTASEMTYTVSGGALNSTQSNPMTDRPTDRQTDGRAMAYSAL